MIGNEKRSLQSKIYHYTFLLLSVLVTTMLTEIARKHTRSIFRRTGSPRANVTICSANVSMGCKWTSAIRMVRDFVRRTGGINGWVAKEKKLREKKMREASGAN